MSGPIDRQIIELHQAGFRRLRFSFFADEPTLFPRSMEHAFACGLRDARVYKRAL
jgi:hypothetical protein